MKKTKYPQQYAEFQKITADMYKTHIEKNNCYGSGNIAELGMKGTFCRIHDKVSRLKQLVWKADENAIKSAKGMNESVEDTLLDLANYAVIALIQSRNKWGK